MAGEFGFSGFAEALASGRESRQQGRLLRSRQELEEREFGLKEREFEAGIAKEMDAEVKTVTESVRATIRFLSDQLRAGLTLERFPAMVKIIENGLATLSTLKLPVAMQLGAEFESLRTIKSTVGKEAEIAGVAAGTTEIAKATTILGQVPTTGQREQLAGFEEVVPVRSALLDETGAVTTATAAELRKQMVIMLGGSAETALPADLARTGQDLLAESERIIEAGEEDSPGQALALAMKRVPLPEALSFSEIADRGIAAVEQEGTKPPTKTDLASADQKLRVQEATGAVSAFIDFFGNRILGQIDPSFVDPDVVVARQRLALLENEFVVAFKRSPRLPVWEQVKLSRIFQGPAILSSPEGIRVELQNISQLLTENIEIERRILEAPVPIEMKQEALSNIISLAGFRARIRAFELNPAFPEFRTVEDVGTASIEDLRGFVERTPEEALNLLPPEVINSMSDRLTKGQ